jgi:stage II sporulation protein B
VDKPKNGHTIKIKLNGEQQSFKEEPVKKPADKEAEPFKKVIKIDPEYIEQETFKETAAAQESVDESFDWIIPESSENDIVEYKIASSQKSKKAGKKSVTFSSFSKKRNGGAIKNILITAVFAILIGTSFGVLMLKLFITDTDKPAVVQPVGGETGKNTGEEKTPVATASAVIPTQTIFVVQGGYFSTKELAVSGANEVKGKGAAATSIAIDGKEYLFIGVANSVETAKQLGTFYKENNSVEDVYAKSIAVPEKTVAEINETEKAFLESSTAIYQQLSKISASGIVTKTVSDDINTLSEQLKSGDKLSNEKVKSLHADLNSAVEKVKAFQTSKDAKSLIEAQQHLLNFISAYYAL